MPNSDRQQRIWSPLIEVLSDDDRERVEFVFTLTPDEYAALDAPSEDA